MGVIVYRSVDRNCLGFFFPHSQANRVCQNVSCYESEL